MAVAKSGKGGNKEGKGVGKVSREKSSGLRGIEEASLPDQTQGQVVDVRQDPCTLANREARGIFMERDITTVM